MEDHQLSDPKLELWILMALTRRAMDKAREKELSSYNITSRQAAVLYAVQTLGDEAIPAKISQFLSRERHSISNILNRMERKGLLTQSKDLEKRNLIRVRLTEKGTEAHQYQSTRRESIHKIMSTLSAEQRQQLRTCLQLLMAAAEKECQ